MDANDILREQLLDNANQTIDESYDAVFKSVKNPTLPERTFINVFLPFFAGEVAPEEHVKYINAWYSIAKHPYARIDVIGDNGDILFTLPSIINNDGVEPNSAHEGYQPVIEKSILMSNNLPMLGINHLLQESEKIVSDKVEHNPQNQVVVNEWAAILSRYGKLNNDIIFNQSFNAVDTEDFLEY